MTSPRPAAMPGGRVLTGWWKQLSAWRPQSLWIGTVAVSRVEALCRVQQSETLAPLEGAVLANLDGPHSTEIGLLDQRMGVGHTLLARVIAKLEQKLVIARNGSGWVLTKSGEQARQTNTLPGHRVERRSFWFVADLEDSTSQAFVAPAAISSFQPADSAGFNRGSLDALLASAREKSEWKRARGFPLEVESIIAPEATPPAKDLAGWEKIVLVHPYRLQAALITYTRASGEQAVAAFPYQEHGWALGTAPVFDMAAAWNVVFPNLQLEPGDEIVGEAWRKWLAQRGMGDQALDRYRLIRRAERIGVVPPADLPDVLSAPRGDLARGEAWLLLREGSLRRVMPMELESLALKPPEPAAPPGAHRPG